VNYQKDNSNLQAKLKLRRCFLDKYHSAGDANVLDCCQGTAVMWNQLRQEYDLAGYWGVDEKAGRGRIQIDSAKILAQPGWPQNVIDVDTYGTPWKHWINMLPNVTRPLTVFLTIGRSGPGPKRAKIPQEALGAMGLTIDGLSVMSLTGHFFEMSIHYCLAAALNHDLRIVECVEAFTTPVDRWRVPYMGVRLEPV